MLAKGIRTSRKTLVHRARSPLKKMVPFLIRQLSRSVKINSSKKAQ
jgi:hypothetical protein